MENQEIFYLKVVQFIDYSYLSNYIKNTTNIFGVKKSNDDDWKIFSNHHPDESVNILYFIRILEQNKFYSLDTLLLSLHVYNEICIKYAHMFDNYTSVFATIYVVVNKIISDEYVNHIFLANILKINQQLSLKMIYMVEKIINTNDIYFSSKEKEKIISILT